MERPKRARVRPTLAHGVMVLAGLVTFVLVTATLRDRSATVAVVVAVGAVEAGTSVADAPLATIDVPAGSPLLGALVPLGDVAPGGRLARPLAPGQPLLRADLLPAGGAEGLRTLALPVERLVVDGLGLRPGDRVDVIAVEPDGRARFVAVDVGVARLPGEAAAGLGRPVETATTWLAVGVDDQQALDLAGALGRGRLVVARATGAAPIATAVGAGADGGVSAPGAAPAGPAAGAGG